MTKEHNQDEEPELTDSSSNKTVNSLNILLMAIIVGALLVSGSILYASRQFSKALGAVTSAGVQNSAVAGVKTAQAPQPQAPAPGQKVIVDVGHLPAQGNPNAKVKIVAFEDFRCPFCEKFFTATEPQIIKDYVDTGKAVLYFRQYQFLGAPSVVAGNAAECANEQNKFWVFHDYLYKNQPQESDTSLFTTDNLTKIAGQLGINTSKFKACLSSTKYDKNVQDDLAAGQKAGVTGTPTVFVNGVPIVGAQPYSAFKATIDKELMQ